MSKFHSFCLLSVLVLIVLNLYAAKPQKNSSTNTPSLTKYVFTEPQATFNATQFIFSYTVPGPQIYYRVFLDTDRNTSTGYYVGLIGANYLLQNGNLYSYVGPGWKWIIIKPVNFSINNNLVSWTINRNDIGNNDCGGTLDYAVQIVSSTSVSTVPKTSLTYSANSNCSTPAIPRQKIAIPSYFYPDCAWNSNCLWNNVVNSIPPLGLAIINPNSGPGSSFDQNYLTQVTRVQAAGGIVIGYVYTSYGTRNISAVEYDIDSYYNWYPTLDGIFFDEGYNSDCNQATYYMALNQYVKAKGGKGVTVINYGANTQECYVNASDILLIYEDVASNYMSWKPSSWVSNYPASRFWNLIYNAPQSSVQTIMDQSKVNNAGWIYVTPDNLPNPWDTIPTGTYWSTELNAVH